jgi:anthranilate phosphoribosyltransferase
MKNLLWTGAAAALLAACSVTGSEAGERLGIIQMLPTHPAAVTLPTAVGRGEPFEVTVISHGGGCVRQGPTRVRINGSTAEVRPYDIDSGNSVCTADVAEYEHTATLRFDQPGTATVRIIGTGYPGPETITVTRTVTIQ